MLSASQARPRMVFHHPLPIHAEAASASGIRPRLMAEAFRALGYEVDMVCGYAAERARAVAAVDERLRQGVRYALMYSESSTEPTLLTDPHHLPLHPRLDFAFMARLKARGVPIGLFYRDIYWRFPHYGSALPSWKRWAALAMYRYDLLQYRRLLDVLYLPSMEMAAQIPYLDPARMKVLPPGCTLLPGAEKAVQRKGLHLLYVGGIGPHSEILELIRAMHGVPEVSLTICTRAAEWRAVSGSYALPEAGNVRIEHRSGDGLRELYEQADVAMLFVKPDDYREFAVPFKLFEYIGQQLPVIASAGTMAAEFVSAEGLGWVIPYEAQALQGLLRGLIEQRSALAERQQKMQLIAERHSWQARARQVVTDLTGAA